MNSANGKPRPARRQFRPIVAGLEGRQMLSSSGLSTVASFNGSNQAIISGLVMDGQGNLYGTTSSGGEGGTTKGDATVFEIHAGSTKITTLASFNGVKGYGISGVQLDAQGNLYGTMGEEGGIYGDGIVFEIAKDSKKVTTLATFDGTNGEFPNGVIPDAQGNLYGTAGIGGAHGAAVEFEVIKGSNTVTPFASFVGTGQAPKGLVMDAQGNLYGTDAGGGAYGAGSVFEIAKGSHTVATLASFNTLDGAGISNVVVDGQGNLFGTTEDGGAFGVGAVFEIARGSNTVTTLGSFDTLNGSAPDPISGLVMDGQGNLYGTTEAGGSFGDGTVFELDRSANTLLNLDSFTSKNGALVSGLILDGQGNLEGTMDGSGGSGGTTFKLAIDPTTTSPAIPIPATPIPASVETTTTTTTTTTIKTPVSKAAVNPRSIAKAHQSLMKLKIGESKTVAK